MTVLTVAEVVGLVARLAEAIGRPSLSRLAEQLEPRLRAEPLPAEDDEMDRARRAALARAQSDADEVLAPRTGSKP